MEIVKKATTRQCSAWLVVVKPLSSAEKSSATFWSCWSWLLRTKRNSSHWTRWSKSPTDVSTLWSTWLCRGSRTSFRTSTSSSENSKEKSSSGSRRSPTRRKRRSWLTTRWYCWCPEGTQKRLLLNLNLL